MLQSNKSNNWVTILIVAFILSIVFKFIYLDRIPIFADEAFYLMTADIVRKNPVEIIFFIQRGILQV